MHSFTSNHRNRRLKASTTHSHSEWIPEVVPLQDRVPMGPPHVGKREDLLRENKVLHKKLESKMVELQTAEMTIETLGMTREAEKANYIKESRKLTEHIAELNAELGMTKQAAQDEKRRLEMELQEVKDELSACGARLAKTHEALGITAEKANMYRGAESEPVTCFGVLLVLRVLLSADALNLTCCGLCLHIRRLEKSQGRLQIDLHGTLTTLEEASRRHRAEKLQTTGEAAARQEELLEALQASRSQAATLTQMLEAESARSQGLREQLAQAQVEADSERLHLRHQIERLVERVDTAEARRLDPNVLSSERTRSRASIPLCPCAKPQPPPLAVLVRLSAVHADPLARCLQTSNSPSHYSSPRRGAASSRPSLPLSRTSRHRRRAERRCATVAPLPRLVRAKHRACLRPEAWRRGAPAHRCGDHWCCGQSAAIERNGAWRVTRRPRL